MKGSLKYFKTKLFAIMVFIAENISSFFDA